MTRPEKLNAAATAPDFASALRTARESVVAVHPDAIGTFLVESIQKDVSVLRSVSELDPRLFSPAAPGHLSRSGAYYAEPASLERITALAAWAYLNTNLLEDYSDVRIAFFEHLHRELANVAFAVGSLAISAAQLSPIYSRVARRATELARLSLGCLLYPSSTMHALEEISRFAMENRDLNFYVPSRFRELDDLIKIIDEAIFVSERILPKHSEVRTILSPLSGAQKLGDALALSIPPHIKVENIRLGFHDLASINFRDETGALVPHLMAEPQQLERLSSELAIGETLVVDDNVGTGQTLAAARELVRGFGGVCLTRAVETSWSLYGREPGHSLAHVVDLPGLRPNLHHTWQRFLTYLLANGSVSDYVSVVAESKRPSLSNQLSLTLTQALASDDWTVAQVDHLKGENEFFDQNSQEEGVPWLWTTRRA